MKFTTDKNIIGLLFLIVAAAWIAGLFIDIMEIDAAQYATMSRDMLKRGDFFHLYDRERDYLDKPPMVFWATALSFKLFGPGTVSYKLPSVIFAAWATWSVYGLTNMFYGKRTALYAALILASCQAVFVMNNDVKTDMYMIAPVIFSCWKMAAFSRNGKWKDLIWGALGVGLAMLAKGPVGLIAVAAATGGDHLIRRDWEGLFNWKWLLAVPVIGLVILPFVIGQYDQYGSEGVIFFLWTQSFGRITGASEWANDAPPYFLVHTFAWAFLPWILLFLVALVRSIQSLINNVRSGKTIEEVIMLSGFFLLFIAFSLSRFKLPHYIFIVIPFAAVISAKFIVAQEEKSGSKWTFTGTLVIAALSVLLGAFLAFFSAAGLPIAAWIVVLSGLCVAGYFLFREHSFINGKIAAALVLYSLANFILNTGFYPFLLDFQTTSVAGKYVNENGISPDKCLAFKVAGRGFDFYSGKVMEGINGLYEIPEEGFPFYIYTNEEGLKEIEKGKYLHSIELEKDHFKVSALSLPFLNPSTRGKVTSKRYLVKISGE